MTITISVGGNSTGSSVHIPWLGRVLRVLRVFRGRNSVAVFRGPYSVAVFRGPYSVAVALRTASRGVQPVHAGHDHQVSLVYRLRGRGGPDLAARRDAAGAAGLDRRQGLSGREQHTAFPRRRGLRLRAHADGHEEEQDAS